MTNNKTYTGKDIQVLSDRDHVRKRTSVYLGSMELSSYKVPILDASTITYESFEFIPAVYKAIGEILDNAIDELTQINIKRKLLTITADPLVGSYTVADNGRGVPIDKHATGKYTPEVVFGSLRSGRNFGDDKHIGVIGTNGVGSSITNYTSTDFKVDVWRDNQHYTQLFVDGCTKISKPTITKSSKKLTGTEISFTLDGTVFKTVSIPPAMIKNRAIEIALSNPDITVEYNGERFAFKQGFVSYLNQILSSDKWCCFKVETEEVSGEIYVIPSSHTEVDERMFTWVNSSFLFDGGKCNTQFLNAFMDRAIESVEKRGAKSKISVTKNDVRYGITVIANLKLKSPNYDSQAKTRLSGPDLRKEMVNAVDVGWKQFTKQFDSWIDDCVVRAAIRQNKAATNSIEEDTKKKGKVKVDGLLDATSKIRSNCMIFVVEGDCLHESTSVPLLRDGIIQHLPIKDALSGDCVITHTGAFKQITQVSKSVKVGVKLNIGSDVIITSHNHRLLTYDKTTLKFGWVKVEDIDVIHHQLVKSILNEFVGCESFTVVPNLDNDSGMYPLVVVSEYERTKSSLTHPFVVLNVDIGAFEEVMCDQLDSTIHYLALSISNKT